MKARRGAHTVYRLAYHYVWVPRYRRKVLTGGVAQRLEEMIREICAARFMNVIKSSTARELYVEFPRLQKTHWGGRLWADGYYVGSAGEHVTSELIRKYIEYRQSDDSSQARLL